MDALQIQNYPILSVKKCNEVKRENLINTVHNYYYIIKLRISH